MDEVLDPAEIEGALRGRFGRPLRYLPSVGSTNDEAMTWAVEGAPEGSVVVTDHQTAGRGRWGRTWSSEPGRLLQSSTVLRPGVAPSAAGVVTTCVGVACARGVEEVCGVEVGLKWPNDVTVEGKKIAGILVESRVDGGATIEIAIAGVGINVNWAIEEMPEEIRDRATSLSVVTGKACDRIQLLASFLFALETVYSRVKANLTEEVIAEAALRSDILGQAVTVRFLDGSTIAGRAVGLDETGALKLESADGERVIQVGEIEQLRQL